MEEQKDICKHFKVISLTQFSSEMAIEGCESWCANKVKRLIHLDVNVRQWMAIIFGNVEVNEKECGL